MKASPNALLSTSLASASSLVLLQLFSRLFTFALNQALVRMASPQSFGTVAIQFELLLSTILFLCREGVRNSLLRTKYSPGTIATSGFFINISLLPVLSGIPITIFTCLIYIFSSAVSTTSQPHFFMSVVMYALAAVLELLSEPLYIRAQNQFRFEVRIRAEGSSVIMKTLVAFILLVVSSPEWTLVSFAMGQLAYSLTTLVTYIYAFGRDTLFMFRPATNSTKGGTTYFDQDILSLATAMTFQSIVKHFLTEGDKFLVSRLSPLADQGGYALASNYGSLVARIIFQPIEETSRIFFSKVLSSPTNKDSLHVASRVLMSLLLLFTHLFLFLVAFGPPYLPVAVSILLPSQYHNTSAPSILHAYIYYIPTMAFNGLLEAFMTSTSSPADIRSQSRLMLLFSFIFIVTAVGFSRGLGWSDKGLVWANIINLGARALYAWSFAGRFFRQRGAVDMLDWRKAIPPSTILGIFAIVSGLTRWSAKTYGKLTLFSQLEHVSLGIGCFTGCFIACAVFERQAFQEIIAIIRRNK